jgi:hypothetical protein
MPDAIGGLLVLVACYVDPVRIVSDMTDGGGRR